MTTILLSIILLLKLTCFMQLWILGSKHSMWQKGEKRNMAKTVEANAPRKARSQMGEVWHQFRRNKGAMVGSAIVLIIVFVALFADVFLDYDTQVVGQNVAERLQWPSARHWFGTDELGRDIFFRVLYGTRFSCSVGLVAVTIGLVIGVTLGAIAGFYGGTLEEVIMRSTDILGAVPQYADGDCYRIRSRTEYLESDAGSGNYERAAVCTYYKGCGTDCEEPGICRSVEGHRVIKQKDYFLSTFFPNCLSPIIVQATPVWHLLLFLLPV